jgi:hypothetical protein
MAEDEGAHCLRIETEKPPGTLPRGFNSHRLLERFGYAAGLEVADLSELAFAEESPLEDALVELESPLEADPLPPPSPDALEAAAGADPSAASVFGLLLLLA